MHNQTKKLPEYREKEKTSVWRLLTFGLITILLIAATYNEPKIYNFLNGMKTDTISESTADTGVTIDGLLIKDGAASGMVSDTDFDANTILKADSDDTPIALTVPEQTVVGRITSGVITALTAAQVRTLINVEDGADVTDETNVKAALSGATISTATVATDDKVLIQDTDDSDNLKTVTAQSIADLAGDVSAASTITDNAVVRGDGGSKGVQDSGVVIDDTANVSGLINLTMGGYIDLAEISTPANPAADVGRFYVKDDTGTTKLYFRDSAGSETDLLAGSDTNKVMVSGNDTTPNYLVSKIPSGTGVTMTETGDGGDETLVPSLDINGLTARTAFASGDKLAIYEDGVGIRKIDYDDLPGAAGGEANTCSNAGSGTSVYYQKTGVDIELNGIKSENNRIAVALDGVTHDIELTLTEANIDLSNCDNSTSLFKNTRTGVYRTIYVDAGAMVPCTTNGAASGTNEYGTNDIDMDYMAFDGGATEERVQFKIVMPDEWDRSTIKVKFWWSSATGSTAGDTVEWGIKAIAIGDSDVIDSALGTAQVITDTLLADNGTDMQTTSATPSLTVGGTPALGDIIIFEVYRNTDGTDDMTEDAWLFGVQIQYLENSTEPSGW